MPFIKIGAGTISLSGINTHIGTITVNEGTLALDNNGSLNIGNPIVLSHGALDMGAFTNSVGTLTVNEGSAQLSASGYLIATPGGTIFLIQ